MMNPINTKPYKLPDDAVGRDDARGGGGFFNISR